VSVEARRYRRLVVPGRFQPLHYGHLHTFRKASELADEVIIVIGSAQESYTLRNPLTAGERFEMIELALNDMFGKNYRNKFIIVPVSDIEMNKVWVQYLRMLLPPFDGVVSGNELVLMLFEDMGLASIRPELVNRGECRGTTIRKLLIQRDERWKKCIPPRVLEYLAKVGFEERLLRLSGSEG
jgi:nicotinamide-nucleotide adenylyltransferase